MIQAKKAVLSCEVWCKRVSSIPAFELGQQYNLIAAEVGQTVQDVLASGRYIGGAPVETFEQQFADYIGTADCIGCNSGTDALYLALRALNLGPGDEVITSAFTFFATAETISAVGATPVFVDIEPTTFNLDLNRVEAAITARTKAIIPVHLFGQPIDMTRLMALAQAHGLWVIEDCAQSTGATWAGAMTGSIGQIGCFSFYPTKNLGACGDGGAITTQDRELAARMRRLRDHGQTQRYRYEDIGINSRLDAIQAAILQIKLRHLDSWNANRRQIAARYQEWLAPLPNLITPTGLPGGEGVWNQYTIRVTAQTSSSPAAYRDQVRSQLQQRGIGTALYYPLPLHLQPVYTGLGYQVGSLPVTEQVAQEVISLPMFPELTEAQQEQVVYALKDVLSAKIC
jgi:dTDP-4-amino-4,6-dideoxygalactose transaminase